MASSSLKDILGNVQSGPFAKPLSRKRFRREARSRAKLQYGPELRNLRQQRFASKRRQREIGKAFRKYGELQQELAGNVQGAYAKAGEQIGAAAQGTTDYAEQLRQRLASEGAESARLRGVAYDPSGSQLSAEGQLSRLSSANTLQGVTATQAAGQAGYGAARQSIGQRARIEAQMREMDRRRQLADESRGVKKERGAFLDAAMTDAREAERNYHLGLLSAMDPKLQRRFLGKEAAKDRRHSRRESAKDRRQGRNDERRADRKDRKGQLREASALLKTKGTTWLNQVPPGQRDQAVSLLADKLVSKYGFPPSVARRAARKWTSGKQLKR